MKMKRTMSQLWYKSHQCRNLERIMGSFLVRNVQNRPCGFWYVEIHKDGRKFSGNGASLTEALEHATLKIFKELKRRGYRDKYFKHLFVDYDDGEDDSEEDDEDDDDDDDEDDDGYDADNELEKLEKSRNRRLSWLRAWCLSCLQH